MKRRILIGAMVTSATWSSALEYPATRKMDLVEKLHGVDVADPYRWLEDDRSEETAAWVKEQNRVTEAYLSGLAGRGEIAGRLRELWNFERIGMPSEYGGKWFFSYNSGLQNQSVLKVADSPEGEGKLLLDPAEFSKDGTVSLADYQPSEDGKYLAYAISRGGSDWKEIRVREVESGKDREDLLRWVKFSGISWAKDGSGFYYSRYQEPSEAEVLTGKNENQKMYFHRLGTPQAEDELVYERPDQPRWGLGGGLTEDGQYLVIHVSQGTDPKNRFFYKKAGDADAKVVELLDKADASYDFFGNVGSVFYFRTDLDAPRGRILAIDVEKPEREAWKEIVGQRQELLRGASLVGGKLLVTWLKDARSVVTEHQVDGAPLKEVALPGIGSVAGFGGRMKDRTTYYAYSSFTEPGAIFRYDLETSTSVLVRKPKVAFDADAYETKQVFVTSRDGTRVPMFITAKKGLVLDGSHRVLMTGYGGFNIPQVPGFAISRAVWLERGGVLAVVNLRGGGEYGSEWHLAGTRLRKQNVFDDFISAGEWLVKEKYTTPSKLGIQGGSNGGLLVGACLTQRPDLFGAALPAVGVMDMLRFHRFTIGWAWEQDYGSAENPEEFQALLKYSPYHVLKPGVSYPATLVTTADHDDRVVPAHSFKFAARLQECQAKDGPPVLIRVDTSAGHGAGTSLEKAIAKTADEWAFLEAHLR